MEYLINDREPQKMFNFFEEICSIPHGSGNESKLSDYLEEFAKKHSLEYYRDALGNVLIRKPSSDTRNDTESVMLQAHIDMVCEKLPEIDRDFNVDPLKLKVDGDMLSASGTTLGADNGIGVATILSILDCDNIVHPELECLFTISEETGMDGALGFDYSMIKSRRIVNLDSTEEGYACCGCAGGTDLGITLPIERIPTLPKLVTVSISGLAGGHSGQDIDLGRQNAVKLLSTALLSLYQNVKFCLVSIDGGVKPNVIPSTASATLAFFDNSIAKTADKFLKDTFNSSKANFCRADKGFRYSFKNATASDAVAMTGVFSYRSTATVLAYLASAPFGVLKHMPDDRTSVLSSVNLGVLRTEAECCKAIFFARSDDDNENTETVNVISGATHLAGGSCEITSSTPGWKFKKGGALQVAYSKACKHILGKTPKLGSIHAGLECGAMIAALNAIDGKEGAEAISIGADLYDIHTVKERVSLSSCERFYRIVTELLYEL